MSTTIFSDFGLDSKYSLIDWLTFIACDLYIGMLKPFITTLKSYGGRR